MHNSVNSFELSGFIFRVNWKTKLMKTGSAVPSGVAEAQPSPWAAVQGQRGDGGSGAAREPPSPSVGTSAQSHPESLWDRASL